MMTCPFPLTDVISQIKAYIFSVSMENQAVKLCYLSQTSNANQKQPQNNQLQALHFLQWQNKMPKMKKTCQLKPVCLILISDGLFLPPHVWLCLWLHCCLSMLSVHALQKKKHVKTSVHDLNCSTHVIYRITMPAHDFKFHENTTAYRKDEHQYQSFRLKKIKLRLAQKRYTPICLNHIYPPFFWILRKFSFPYCLWLYCLWLGPPWANDESKDNTSTNSKGKKVCTIPNKRLGKNSSEMLPKCIYHCRVVVKKIKTVHICTCLSPYIISFLTVKHFFLALNTKDHLELKAYLFPFTNKSMESSRYLTYLYCKKCVFLYRFSFNKENSDFFLHYLHVFYLL